MELLVKLGHLLRCVQKALHDEHAQYQAKRDRIREELEEKIQEARDDNEPDRVQLLQERRDRRLHQVTVERRQKHTQRLLQRASELQVPTPPRTDDDGNDTEYWNRSPFTGSTYLTREGQEWLREKIRNEEKWKMDRRKHWAAVLGQVLGAATGLVGAATGLVAVLL